MGYPEKAFEGYRDFVWAQRAYNLRFGNCQMNNCEDFKQGFIEGYCEMCEGGKGHTPVLPPQEYWSERYQSSQGKLSVESWFRGYPEGVRAAKQDGASRHRNIYISKEMQSAIELSREENRSVIRAEDRQPTPASQTSSRQSVPQPSLEPSVEQAVPSETPLPTGGTVLPGRFLPPIVDPAQLGPIGN